MCEMVNIEIKFKEDGEPPAKKTAPSIRLGAGFKWNLQALAVAADAVESGGKSPVSALNELGVRVAYKVLRQGGPPHCPSFTVAVTVADMTFEGWGHSKREARASAARACLTALLARAGRVLPAPGHVQDFTSDDHNKYKVAEFQCLDTQNKMTPPTALMAELPSSLTPSPSMSPPPGAPPVCPAAALFGAPAAPAAHKSPINTLYENYPGLNFACTFGDGSTLDGTQAPLQLSHSMRFKVVCHVKEQIFEGYGSSKKLAKLAAARSALAALGEARSAADPAAAPRAGFLPQASADHISKLVNEKFTEIMKNDVIHSKRKVLAGIVMTTDNKVEGAKVIAVTTGTKCVSGEHMSVRGRSVNDCHAEVAARRCLQRYLYAQLLMYASQPDPRAPIPESDLEPVPGGGYQLRPRLQLHLYVSTAPCGDARIFSPHDQHDPPPDKHPNRLARGQLRTKIESGEGTIPVKNCSNLVQTWDGVMQGERLLTMSCSDKVARWCCAGLQGALLALLVRPLYLHSLVLGSLLHPHHAYRALCGRIEAYISMLPTPFHLRRPLLARAASAEARTPARAPSFSVIWCCTNPIPEVVNATTGKLENGQPSLLCKQSMFARWQYLVRRLPLLPQNTDMDVQPVDIPSNLDSLLYNEAKLLCPAYQAAKNRLLDAFEKAKLGRWIKKPLEQDQFACELLNANPDALFAWTGLSPTRYSAVQGTRGVLSGARGLGDGLSGNGAAGGNEITKDSNGVKASEHGVEVDENGVEVDENLVKVGENGFKVGENGIKLNENSVKVFNVNVSKANSDANNNSVDNMVLSDDIDVTIAKVIGFDSQRTKFETNKTTLMTDALKINTDKVKSDNTVNLNVKERVNKKGVFDGKSQYIDKSDDFNKVHVFKSCINLINYNKRRIFSRTNKNNYTSVANCDKNNNYTSYKSNISKQSVENTEFDITNPKSLYFERLCQREHYKHKCKDVP